MELGQLSEQAKMDALPRDWQYYTIGQTLTLTNGLAFRPSEWKTHGTPIIRIQNLNDDNSPYNYYDGPISEKYRIRAGDILFAWSGTTGTSFGARIWTGPNAVLNQHIFKVTPDKTKVAPYYSFLVLQNVQKEIERQAHGFKSSFVHVKKSDLVKVCLPIPPIPEQESIGKALSEVDQLIANLERLTEKKQAIKQGLTQRLLTGKTRLPGFVDEWREVKLRDEGTTYGGLVGKDKNDFGAGSASFVTFMEVMASARLLGHRLERVRVRPGERQNQVQRGDVLFNGSSETPEEVAFASVVEFNPSPSTYLNSFCFGYRLKDTRRIDPTFLAYFFRSSNGRELVASLAQGATRYNIAKTKLLEVQPILPPVDEQRAIVEVLRDAESELAALNVRLTRVRAVKTGMMQQLLTGRTRLPVREGAA
ncbi:restriction endonuclease subunit S [Streptomyces griseoaurantiacus]|uniref:restriction endonuclease subunit S n=1 Tax=Streptomyces griseoaurantiacus TaxID=68213 RepID=UPI002E2D93DD|nr:restriction endonuclease subunit S [Streptomyces jietaisiensis]